MGSTIEGGGGGDVLAAAADGDLLLGWAGDDTLTSTFNDTTLIGGKGDDSLAGAVSLSGSADALFAFISQTGRVGEDTLVAAAEAIGAGVDARAETSTSGGYDNDTHDVMAFATVLPGSGSGAATAINRASGLGGDDRITALAEADGVPSSSFVMNEISGGWGNDAIFATARSDVDGDNATVRNVILSGSGNDTVEAFAEGNAMTTELAENDIRGGNGHDVIHSEVRVGSNSDSSRGRTVISGGNGDDSVSARHLSSGEDSNTEAEITLVGGTGNDTLTADTTAPSSASFDPSRGSFVTHLLDGGSGDDEMTSWAVARTPDFTAEIETVMRGRGGNDEMFAFSEGVFDILSFDDPASGAPSQAVENRLYGMSGDDDIVGEISPFSGGVNFLYGGNGHDRVQAFGGADNVLDGGRGRDTLIGSQNDDTALGRGDDDRLIGRDGDDSLSGHRGDDELFGDAGMDTLVGGSGEDTLDGGFGDDLFTGGSGSDLFVFNLNMDQGVETITDFDATEDRLGFIGFVDAGAPGLADDLDAILSITDGGIGGDVFVTFAVGTIVVLEGAGTGAIGGVADLVEDPTAQLLSV